MNSKRILAVAAASLIFSSLSLSLFASFSPDGRNREFRQALSLYEKGMYSQARALFEAIDDPQAEGYAVLCSACMKSADYKEAMDRYLDTYPYSGLVPKIRWRHALNLFDEQDYKEAGRELNLLEDKDVDKEDLAELTYKKGYCDFYNRDEDAAEYNFKKVDKLDMNDYTAPARYGLGYINYENEKFREAIPWFELSRKDPRFEQVSNYYIIESHYMLKDYKYVTENAPDLYDKVPAERRPHFARLISESYLVEGDAATARKYYEDIQDTDLKSRGDYFYAGSLMYATGDYEGAIDNYSKMGERTDSLGQIAEYQMADSYINTRNKVAAMGSFKNAAAMEYDRQIQEDAWFNYAKLSFDLNHDGSVFEQYMQKYPQTAKNDLIYSYIALAALYDHDYAAAVEAYDNIDELDDDMTGNYMRANYLRANQLVRNGSWRMAIPCLKASSYYSDKHSSFNQLSRYWLAESYFRDEQYGNARTTFNELYNLSALDNQPEGKALPYDIAYCYFKENDFDHASRWFDDYVATGDKTYRQDALVRKADCSFLSKDYKGAAAAYGAVIDAYPQEAGIYPYYQAGMAYGLSGDDKSKISVLSKARSFPASDPFYCEALYELGRSYASARQDDKASDCYSSLILNGKDSTYIARAMLGMGLIARNRKNYDSALDYYKKVVAMMPSTDYSADAMAAIESIYQARQTPEEYIAYVESLGSAANVSEGDKEDMLFNSAEQMYLAGNYDKALNSLQSYIAKYPEGSHAGDAGFYIADSYRNLDKKEQACDYYKKVMDSNDSRFREVAALNYARLSYGMERFSDALDGYETLSYVARLEPNKVVALTGMMRSAYAGKQYADAISYADKRLGEKDASDAMKLEAKYIKAKSLMATSRRADAMKLLKEISSETSTPEGAEACYILIQNDYDEGNFEALEKKVYAFSESGSDQTYWMAKSFIVLGDSFADRDDYRQARATFESIRDGYTPKPEGDEVLDSVRMRLDKLSEIGK